VFTNKEHFVLQKLAKCSACVYICRMEQVPGVHFRNFLRNELRIRSSQNPNYSLRSFAKYLGVSPSGLSMVMSGKKPTTSKFVFKVGAKLKLGESELKNFQINLITEKIRPHVARDFEIIDANRLAVIKDWYHYAILNLIRTKDFKPRASWVAKKLGISLGEAQGALERLQNVGMLKIANNSWVDVTNCFTTHTNNEKFSEAARQNQLQLFTKATQAIEKVNFVSRNHTGVTIAINKKDLDRAKAFISQFRKNFMENFDKDANADEVYHLSVALFPLAITNE
jgi:uncharacterized protein (TIGR02147 family)